MSSSPTDSAAAGMERQPPTIASPDTVEVTMPQMGVSVAEGTVVLWHKQPGDWVQADETICEITTDKIDCDVPAPAAGRVVELLVEPEQTVAVGTPLARIATDASAGEAHPAEHLDETGPDHRTAPVAATERDTDREADHHATGSGEPPADATATGEAAPKRHYSPVVQRIARREGVDLDSVPGTGRGGRVRKQDVLAFVQRRAAGNATANGNGTAQADSADPGPPPLHIESPYREDQPAPAPAGAPAPRGAPAPDDVPASVAAPSDSPAAPSDPPAAPADGGERLSRIRRSIAAHMVESLRTAAHCTSITEADMSRIEGARRQLGLTYLPFVACCAIDALRRHPDLNATLVGETLTRHKEVHLGIAVSLGRDGLIVPVIHDAQDLSHEGLAKRIVELARRARAGELSADDVRGGTFTITNPGGYGTIASTPIIKQPQVAILDLEAVVRRPVVVKDEQGGEAVSIRSMTNLCLSWDHRALDGAIAAQFLGAVRERIEHWEGV